MSDDPTRCLACGIMLDDGTTYCDDCVTSEQADYDRADRAGVRDDGIRTELCRVSLIGGFSVVVPVDVDDHWNGFPVPYFTADEVAAFNAWLIANDGADEVEDITGVAPLWINGTPRYDMSGIAWSLDWTE